MIATIQPKYNIIPIRTGIEIDAPSPEDIAICAYLIWEKEGKPSGRLRVHWLQAEAQLMACRAHEKWTENRNGSEC